MRFSWSTKPDAAAPPAGSAAKPEPVQPPVARPANDTLSATALGRVLLAKRNAILIPTVLAALVAAVAVNMVTPRYKSEARILIEPRENAFLRADADKTQDRGAVDAEAIASQVQIAQSREIALEVIRQAKLIDRWEFAGVSSVTRNLLGTIGLGKDPARSAEERVVEAFYDHLSVFPVERSRVIAIEFQSSDAELAARVANLTAESYLQYQQASRQGQAQSASRWLSGEIEQLRKKVAEAESRVEDFRVRSDLFVGGNGTLNGQQLSDLNAQLSSARALKADAEAKARTIREMLKTGRAVETSEMLNSELLRRLTEQRITLRAQLAEQSTTLLDGHPRIRELRAQINDLDRQIREEADRLARASENDSRIAAARMDSINAALDQLKKQAATTGPQDVQLRALEREAKSQRDLLESYLAKYREASARESIDGAPPDASIISRAVIANTPSFPKKIPVILVATLAMLVLSSALVITNALMAMGQGEAPRRRIEWIEPGAPANAEAARVEPPLAAATPATAAQPDPTAAPVIAPAARPSAPQSEPRTMPIGGLPPAPPLSVSPMPVPPGFVAPRPGAAPALALTPMQWAQKIASQPMPRRIAVFSAQRQPDGGIAALALARALAAHRRVILVDLSQGASALANEAVDPTVPGVTELIAGAASFAAIMTRDRGSSAHLIGAGAPRADLAPTLIAARLGILVDALTRAYDCVLLNAPAHAMLPAPEIAPLAPDAVIAVAGLTADAEPLARVLLQQGFQSAEAMDAPFGRVAQSAA